MANVGAAIGAAQPIVGRTDIEKEHAFRGRHVGEGKEVVGGRVHDDEARLVLVEHAFERRLDVGAGLDDRLRQLDGDADEAARGV